MHKHEPQPIHCKVNITCPSPPNRDHPDKMSHHTLCKPSGISINGEGPPRYSKGSNIRAKFSNGWIQRERIKHTLKSSPKSPGESCLSPSISCIISIFQCGHICNKMKLSPLSHTSAWTAKMLTR